MRATQRPWFHAQTVPPLTGREPMLGALAARLSWCGPGWGRHILQGPDGSGRTRLLDEVQRRHALTSPLIRIDASAEDGPPGEALRLALARLLPPEGRDAVRRRLANALGGDGSEVEGIVSWLLDGAEAGFGLPETARIQRALRAIVPTGPLLVDDLDRLDAGTRAIVAGEGGRGGLGVLATTTRLDGHAPDECQILTPLAHAQIELLLRRWLRHPVTVRRLSGPLFERSGGWVGRAVQLVRTLGRTGALAVDSRGVRIVRWPPKWGDEATADTTFTAFADALPPLERSLLEAAALQAFDEDLALLARAVGSKPRFVLDLQAEIRARWSTAGRGLFPSLADRAALAGALAPDRRRDLGRRLSGAWRRRSGEALRGVRDGAACLRAALASEDPRVIANARDGLLRVLPPRVASASPVVRLISETPGVVVAKARTFVSPPVTKPVGGDPRG